MQRVLRQAECRAYPDASDSVLVNSRLTLSIDMKPDDRGSFMHKGMAVFIEKNNRTKLQAIDRQ